MTSPNDCSTKCSAYEYFRVSNKELICECGFNFNSTESITDEDYECLDNKKNSELGGYWIRNQTAGKNNFSFSFINFKVFSKNK